MPTRLKLLFKFAIIGAIFFSLNVSAKPVVVVSVEPLYDIVAGLMKGVNEPFVLLKKNQLKQQLSKKQVKQLLMADMIIRVGDGLESTLGESLKQELNLLSSYTLTLSKYMPLLRKSSLPESVETRLSERQQQHDLRFWMDPKLLAMATRYITPQLVRMDPEHQEQYLENELQVLEQIKHFAQKTARAINGLSVIEQHHLAELNPYIAHRYINQKQMPGNVAQSNSSLKKKLHCIQASREDFIKLSINSNDIVQNLKVMLEDKQRCLIDNLAISL